VIAGLTLTAAVGTSLAALASAPSPPTALWVPAVLLTALFARMAQVAARKQRRELTRWSQPLETP
jgi:hypothetical protein